MTVAQYLDTSDKREPADPFLNNVVLPTHLTSILLSPGKSFQND